MNSDIRLTSAAFGLGLFCITDVLFDVPGNLAMVKAVRRSGCSHHDVAGDRVRRHGVRGGALFVPRNPLAAGSCGGWFLSFRAYAAVRTQLLKEHNRLKPCEAELSSHRVIARTLSYPQ